MIVHFCLISFSNHNFIDRQEYYFGLFSIIRGKAIIHNVYVLTLLAIIRLLLSIIVQYILPYI